MPHARTQAECPTCKRLVLAERASTNHTLHLLLTVFTCGFWVVVWALDGMCHQTYAYRCTRCGTEV